MSDLEPGSSLREAREAAGLTAQDVADSLNLLVSHVEAIEANEFQRMNADIFVRGYVRSYARFLNLSPEPLLRATEPYLKPATARKVTRDITVQSPIKPMHKVIASLVVAALLWLGANWMFAHADTAYPESANATEQHNEV